MAGGGGGTDVGTPSTRQVLTTDSQFVGVPQLDMYQLPPTQVAVDRCEYVRLKPAIGVDRNSESWEFTSPGGPWWALLDETYVVYKASIERADGKPMVWAKSVEAPLGMTEPKVPEGAAADSPERATWKTLHDEWAAADEAAPITGLATTLFKNITISTPSQTLYDSGPNQPYLAHITTLLNANEQAQRTYLATGLWTIDDSKHARSEECGGFQARAAAFRKNAVVEMVGKLTSNLFALGRAFVNYVDLRFTLRRASDEFCIVSYNRPERAYRLCITDMQLLVKRALLTPGLELALASQLKTHPFRYPLRRLAAKTFVVPANSLSADFLLHTTIVPRRLLLCLVPEDCYVGHYYNSPFVYAASDVNTVEVVAAGRRLPAAGYGEIDFARGFSKQPYNDLLRSIGQDGPDTRATLTWEDWATYRAIYGLCLDNNLDANTAAFSVIERGPTSVRITFRSPTGQNLVLLAVSEFDSILTVNDARECVAEYVPM